MTLCVSSDHSVSIELEGDWMVVPTHDDEILAAVFQTDKAGFVPNMGIALPSTDASDSQAFYLGNYIYLEENVHGFRRLCSGVLEPAFGATYWIAYAQDFDDAALRNVVTIQYFPVIAGRSYLISFALLESALESFLPLFHAAVLSLRIAE